MLHKQNLDRRPCTISHRTFSYQEINYKLSTNSDASQIIIFGRWTQFHPYSMISDVQVIKKNAFWLLGNSKLPNKYAWLIVCHKAKIFHDNKNGPGQKSLSWLQWEANIKAHWETKYSTLGKFGRPLCEIHNFEVTTHESK